MTQTTDEFSFSLPKKLIAQRPAHPRDHSRLLVVDRRNGSFKHDQFYNLPNYLSRGDCIVVNNSKVVPFRLHGKRIRATNTKNIVANIELLLLHEVKPRIWETLARPAKKLQSGDQLAFAKRSVVISFSVLRRLEEGRVLLRCDDSRTVLEKKLEVAGEMPTPPYIRRSLKSKNEYQTLYAKTAGSAAAPTAGLHFTKRTFHDFAARGIRKAAVTLHVGLGTFQPITAKTLDAHTMHAERIFLSRHTAHVLHKVKQTEHKVVAVGTTALRTLESCSDTRGVLHATPRGGKETDIFITPGYHFRTVDSLLTNFHLPQSTLFVLVCAFAGTNLMKRAYAEAIQKQYRFFSFGDAMLIL